MSQVEHDTARPSWLDMQLDHFAGPTVYAVADRSEYRPPAATCQECGPLEISPDFARPDTRTALRMTARNHVSETGHAVTLTSGERTTFFEVPPAGVFGADPMGTLDMFADLP